MLTAMGVHRKRLHWIVVCMAVFVSAQFLLIVTLNQLKFSNDSDVVYSKIALPKERARIRDILVWRDFIANTPEQPEHYYNYNERRSNELGIIRPLPDTRNVACSSRNYSLPSPSHAAVSIVICFHNEARSMLLRTIVSLLQRTPGSYLHELILIDDYSDDEQLLSAFEWLVQQLQSDAKASPSPRFIKRRNAQRMGLIASRNFGASLATGDYLFFLDSHCEVNVGWLEPLLERILAKRHIAVSPVLDSIDAATLTYFASATNLMGGFDWNLHFHWVVRDSSDSKDQPFNSPIFAGGVFMISRDWFFKLNCFNTLLKTWGGESIEFSIKLWLCGGQIEIVPCSRIGHIFRQRHVFHFPNENGSSNEKMQHKNSDIIDNGQMTYLRNSKVIAESWLDEYKAFFYALKPEAKGIAINVRPEELLAFKRSHKCRPFAWYLCQVFPQLKLPNDEFKAFGPLRNKDQCMQVTHRQTNSSLNLRRRQRYHHHSQLQLHMSSCYRIDVTHWYLQRPLDQLQMRYKANSDNEPTTYCLRVAAYDDDPAYDKYIKSSARNAYYLVLAKCNDVEHSSHRAVKSDRWLRWGAQLQHATTHLCLDNPLKDVIVVSQCRYGASSQLFQFAREVQYQ